MKNKLCILLVLSAVLHSGCAMPSFPKLPFNSKGPADGLRDPMAIREFEQRRDAANYKTALARWEHGDTAGCESMLVTLLRRNPEFSDARLTLADLYLETHRPDAAEQQLRTVLEAEPDNPQANHSLGLVLETKGNLAAAVVHLQKAAQLDPNNELYAINFQHSQYLGAAEIPQQQANFQPQRLPAPGSDVSLASSETPDRAPAPFPNPTMPSREPVYAARNGYPPGHGYPAGHGYPPAYFPRALPAMPQLPPSASQSFPSGMDAGSR